MRIRDGTFELTYCTNIHSGSGWAEVLAQLRAHAPALKARVASDAPFGLGLRLSGRESCELLGGDRLARLEEFLDQQGLYVALINGFPYGPFHKEPIKAKVFAPDWRDPERLHYTLRLIEILTRLLPDGRDGGISTNPLSYKPWINPKDPTVWEEITENIVRVAKALVEAKDRLGKLIHLDIEPEPDGLIEGSLDVARFFEEWLLIHGARRLADALGCPVDEASSHLLKHIRICWDTCHMSVEYEEPTEILDRYDALGIQVGRIQVSAAPKMALPDDPRGREALRCALEPFAESTYLHQVIQRNRDGSLRHYSDLPDALPHIEDPAAIEWRTHFHVPIFVERYGKFCSTQDDIRRVFLLADERRFTRHLEIETYTWDVLPPDLKKKELVDSICREYEWVLHVLN